jgi:hypothetical protein
MNANVLFIYVKTESILRFVIFEVCLNIKFYLLESIALSLRYSRSDIRKDDSYVYDYINCILYLEQLKHTKNCSFRESH